MTTDEKDVFIQIQNSTVCSKVLVLLNCLIIFVHTELQLLEAFV